MSGSVTFYNQQWYYKNDYFVYGFRYSWGSWSNNQIKLTITATYTQNSHVTGPISVNANVGTLAGGVTGVLSGQLVGYVCVSAGSGSELRSGGVSGTVTVKASQLNSDGTLRVTSTCNASNMGGSKTYSADIEPPALPVGKPSGSTSVYNITQTTATRSATVGSWGTNASAGSWSWTYGPGNYNYNSGGSTYANLSNLTPNTTYNYKFYIWNAQGKTRTYTNTFRTLPYVAPSAAVSLNSVTNNSITINYSTWDSGIDRFNVFLNGNFYQTIWTTASSGTFTVSGLSPKTTYGISIQPHTPYGDLWGGQTGQAYGTTYPNPVSVNINNTKMIEILPFNAKVSVVSSNAGDTDSYGYTLLNANKGVIRAEIRSSASTYNWTGLTPETTYYARVRVFTKTSGVASAYYDIQFTTPPDQATVFLKVNNLWRRGKVFLKTSGAWIKSKYIYTKVDGQWHKNNNF